MAPILPDVTTLASLPEPTLVSVLDLLFEPSEDLHTLAIPTLRSITFATYPELIDTLRDQLLAIAQSVQSDPSAREPLLSILGSHPRLGAKKVESAQSAAEQAQLQSGAQEEAEKLSFLNQEYEVKFPGLRYVVFVNGRSRDVIMEDMRRRIDRGDFAAEEKEAINVRHPLFFFFFFPMVSWLNAEHWFTYIHRLWQILPRTELRSRRRSRTILLLGAGLRKLSHCLKVIEWLLQCHQRRCGSLPRLHEIP